MVAMFAAIGSLRPMIPLLTLIAAVLVRQQGAVLGRCRPSGRRRGGRRGTGKINALGNLSGSSSAI